MVYRLILIFSISFVFFSINPGCGKESPTGSNNGIPTANDDESDDGTYCDTCTEPCPDGDNTCMPSCSDTSNIRCPTEILSLEFTGSSGAIETLDVDRFKVTVGDTLVFSGAAYNIDSVRIASRSIYYYSGNESKLSFGSSSSRKAVALSAGTQAIAVRICADETDSGTDTVCIQNSKVIRIEIQAPPIETTISDSLIIFRDISAANNSSLRITDLTDTAEYFLANTGSALKYPFFLDTGSFTAWDSSTGQVVAGTVSDTPAVTNLGATDFTVDDMDYSRLAGRYVFRSGNSLYTVSAASFGAGITNITPDTSDFVSTGKIQNIDTSIPIQYSDMALSPDGSKLAVLVTVKGRYDNGAAFPACVRTSYPLILDAATGNLINWAAPDNVSDDASPDNGYSFCTALDWYGDNSNLIFSKGENQSDITSHELYTGPSDGSADPAIIYTYPSGGASEPGITGIVYSSAAGYTLLKYNTDQYTESVFLLKNDLSSIHTLKNSLSISACPDIIVP